MSTKDDSDDLVEFSDRTRVATDRGELDAPVDQDRTTVTTDAGDPNNESTRMVEMPGQDDDEPGQTMLIDSPFADPVPPEPVASVVITEGNDRGRSVTLGREPLVAGRALDNGLVLNDPSVSRRHFRFEYQDDGWLVRDLGSGNGTRVNGEQITEHRLAEGDVILAGQTSLTFHAEAGEDADRTRAVDLPLAVARPASAPASSQPPRIQEPEAPAAIRMQEPPRIRVVSGKAAPGARERRAFPVVPVALGVLAVLAIGAIGGWFLLRESPAPAPAVSAEAPTDPRSEAQDRLRLATEAIAQREWDRATGYLDAAAAMAPDLPGVEEARTRARDEKRYASFLGAARKSIESGSHQEAAGLLASIGESSVYHEEAQSLVASIQGASIQAAVKAVRDQVEAGNHDGARQGLVALIQDHPESAEVIALKAEMETAGIIREPRAATAPATARAPAAARAPRTDLRSALAGYRSGDFRSSSAELRDMAARLRGTDADRAVTMADHVERFGTALAAGREALDGKRLDRAEQELMQALRLDREIESHYQATVREMLGDTFRGRAAQALQNADYARARLSATRSLSYRPDDERSRQILERCEAVARGLFEEARSASSAGRRDEARDKAKQVMNILGDHPLSEQARAFIQ